MKFFYTLCLLCLFQILSFAQSEPLEVVWERVDLNLDDHYTGTVPLDRIFGIDSSVFGVAGDRVFESHDLGNTWSLRGSFDEGDFGEYAGIGAMAGTSEFLFYSSTNVKTEIPYSSSTLNHIYRSGSLEEPFRRIGSTHEQDFHQGYDSVSGFVAKNDQTLLYVRSNSLDGLGYKSVRFTNDQMESWNERSFIRPMSGYSLLNDTLICGTRYFTSTESTKDTLILQRFGSDQFDDLLVDTVRVPILNSGQTFPPDIRYLGGRLFVYTADSLAYTDNWTDWTTGALPVPVNTNNSVWYRHGWVLQTPDALVLIDPADPFAPPVLLADLSPSEEVLLSDLDAFLYVRIDEENFRLSNETQQLVPVGEAPEEPSGIFKSYGDYVFHFTDQADLPPVLVTGATGEMNWTVPTQAPFANGNVPNIVAGPDGKYYAANGQVLYVSEDNCVTWLPYENLPAGFDRLHDIQHGQFIAHTPTQLALSDDNAATWTVADLPGTLPFDSDYFLVVRGDTVAYGISQQAGSSTSAFFHYVGRRTYDVGAGDWEMFASPASHQLPPKFFTVGDYFYRFDPHLYLRASEHYSGPNLIDTDLLPLVEDPYIAGADGDAMSGYLFVQDSVIVYYGNGELQLSTDRGISFNTFSTTAFTRPITGLLQGYPLFTKYHLVTNVAEQYFVTPDHFYAYSDGLLWRTGTGLLQNAGDNYNLTGRLYRDLDDNCSYDPGTDQPLVNHPLRLGDFYTTTDTAGQYRVLLPPAEYEVQVIPPYNYVNECPAWNQPVVLDFSTSSLDLPLTPLLGISDLRATLIGHGVFRPGFSPSNHLLLENQGFEDADSVVVKYWYETAGLSQTAAPPPVAVVQDTLFYEVSIPAGAQLTLEFFYELDTDIPFGTTRSFRALISREGDFDPADNFSELTRAVVNSYDPNDKTAFPAAPLHPLNITEIDYLIRFQNNGNDTAYRVVVVDTLAESYDLLSLQTIEASHPYHFALRENRVAEWTFDNIDLPDSTAGAEGSQGYLHVRVATTDELLHTDTIRNRAAIYFDLNAPVITNSAISTIQKRRFLQQDTLWICVGESVDGLLVTGDTLLQRVRSTPVWDSTFIHQIYALPSQEVYRDTGIVVFEEFLGQIITNPTTIVENLTAANGCDSTVVWEVGILIGTKNEIIEGMQATISPNPTEENPVLRITTDRQRALWIELYGSEGVRLKTLAGDVPIFGDHTFPIPIENLPPGTYHVILSEGTATYRLGFLRM